MDHPGAARKVVEVHPELSFHRLDRHRPGTADVLGGGEPDPRGLRMGIRV